jgi:hypothetical protein
MASVPFIKGPPCAPRSVQAGNSRTTLFISSQLDPETRLALAEAGQRIPEWWRADRFSQEQKKALLRCLIDKVVIHRPAPDAMHCRVVWKGVETTTAEVAITVGSWSLLSSSGEMEGTILDMARQGGGPTKRSPDA